LKRIVATLDGEEIFAAVSRAHILTGNTIIEGNFTVPETRTMVIQLKAGAIPVPLTPIAETTIDATLGQDSLDRSLKAGLVGLGLVLVFMVVYYRAPGLVAATSLLIYAALLLAVFKLLPVTLTLSGLAGVILSIGMAVDANVLIFERVKEELRTGRTLASSMDVGFRRAWTAIFDGNVSTLITCAILWWLGSRLGAPQVTGFSLTLGIGVAVSMFTAVTVSRNLLQLMALTRLGRNTNLFTPEGRARPVGAGSSGDYR
jgi:preprotein translocase subunit SecD